MAPAAGGVLLFCAADVADDDDDEGRTPRAEGAAMPPCRYVIKDVWTSVQQRSVFGHSTVSTAFLRRSCYVVVVARKLLVVVVVAATAAAAAAVVDGGTMLQKLTNDF